MFHLVELGAMAEQVSLASSLLEAGARPPADASRAVTQLLRQVAGLRRKLEIRIARAGLHSTDPRLICEAASELSEVVRLVARVVRCREWLRLNATPPELRALEAMGVRSVLRVAGTARALGSREGLDAPEIAQTKAEAEELYDRGVAAAFTETLEPLEALRRKALYDVLLAVVLGSERALDALWNASLE
jgi:hypothetical protein